MRYAVMRNKRRRLQQQAKLSTPLSLLQTKPRVSQKSDKHEKEADQVAREVAQSAPTQATVTTQAKSIHGEGSATGGTPLQNHSIADSGTALDEVTRHFMETQLGYDFSRVRIHADADTHLQAQALGARAFTIGRHIGFARGQFSPDSTQGRQLLAHELAHVVQQHAVAQLDSGRSSTSPMTPLTNVNVVQRQTTPGRTKTKGSPSPAKKYIKYFKKESFTQHKLNLKNIQSAIALVKATTVGSDLLSWLEQKKININVYFVATPRDLPKESSDANGYFEKIDDRHFNVYVAAGYVSGDFVRRGMSRVWKEKVVDQELTSIADTLFHELLHVWFVVRFPDSGTGHTEKVKPTSIAFGIKTYDEAQYDNRFLAKLKEFDTQQGEALERLRRRAGGRP